MRDPSVDRTHQSEPASQDRACNLLVRMWGEARDWCGYDPYDALNSPAAGLLTAGTQMGRRLLTQARGRGAPGSTTSTPPMSSSRLPAARRSTQQWPGALRLGAGYWRDALFLADGTPKWTPERLYPIDAHC
jgi:hypothetical protein